VNYFEEASPFHFSYIRKRKENFTSYHGFLLTALEEVAFAENSLLMTDYEEVNSFRREYHLSEKSG
jgi:hypothetical protein